MDAEHRQLPLMFRRKLDKTGVDERSAQAALVTSMAQALIKNMPVDQAKLKAAWQDPFVEGESTILLELQAALMEKKANLEPRDFSALRALMDNQKMPMNMGGNTQQIMLQEIELESFNLVVRLVYEPQNV